MINGNVDVSTVTSSLYYVGIILCSRIFLASTNLRFMF